VGWSEIKCQEKIDSLANLTMQQLFLSCDVAEVMIFHKKAKFNQNGY